MKMRRAAAKHRFAAALMLLGTLALSTFGAPAADALAPAAESSRSAVAAEVKTKPVKLVLRLGQRRLFVYQGGKVVKSYPVAIGKPGWETPTGTYRVIAMQVNPTWYSPWDSRVIPPGPNNPLGARWIAFWANHRTSLGFHGTNDEASIGRAASHGCVRLKNADVIDLYKRVRIGTEVIIER
jgi:L,D-transpeptidase ErfK/SrfK